MAEDDNRGFSGERLDHLFKTVKPPQEPGKRRRNKYSEAEVAAAVGCTREYINALRHGRATSPTTKVVAGIAAFFSVPPSYFFSDEMSQKINAQMDLILALAAQKDSRARIEAMRAIADVSPEELPKVTRAIEKALTEHD